MRGFVAVFKREMLGLWVTPLAWIVTAVFLTLQGWSFYTLVEYYAKFTTVSVDQGPLQAYFVSPFIVMSLMMICPALSMRLFAEERRSGTIEALLTAPVSAVGVVFGKYAAVLATYGLMWLPTLAYPIILRNTGHVDWPVVASSYLGIFGIGASYLSIGMFMSAMTRSQLIALVLTIMVLFGTFILGLGEFIFDEGPLRDMCTHISVRGQLGDFAKGIIDLRRVVLDATAIGLPLFMTVRVVDSWRFG
ncbi:MAG: ABC transporter permease [Polyangiaceae bacterium]|nr:ABC transporter permease [Polyangiaceae bacterium]